MLDPGNHVQNSQLDATDGLALAPLPKRKAFLAPHRARFQDSRIGRFVQRDPLGYVGEASLYGYTRSNPIRYIDPTGLLPSFSACEEKATEEECVACCDAIHQNVTSRISKMKAEYADPAKKKAAMEKAAKSAAKIFAACMDDHGMVVSGVNWAEAMMKVLGGVDAGSFSNGVAGLADTVAGAVGKQSGGGAAALHDLVNSANALKECSKKLADYMCGADPACAEKELSDRYDAAMKECEKKKKKGAGEGGGRNSSEGADAFGLATGCRERGATTWGATGHSAASASPGCGSRACSR